MTQNKMNELTNLLDNNFRLTQEETDFVSAPKKYFRIKLSLTPIEYFELAQFAIEKGIQATQTVANQHDLFLNDANLMMVDLAKAFTMAEITKWQYKPSTREHTYNGMTTAQAAIVCKLMQKDFITPTEQRVLNKIFQALINAGFSAEFLTVKIENN